jgi:hypothetical protein
MGKPAAKGDSAMKRAFFASIIAALAFSLAAPGTVMAQGKDKDKKPKVKSYDFSGDNIDGDLVKPDGVAVDARTFASHTSLIRIRKDFIKEILKSAEDL